MSLNKANKESSEKLQENSVNGTTETATGTEHNTANENNTAADPKELAFKHFLNMEAAYRYQEVSPREHVVISRTTSDHIVTFRDIFDAIFPELSSTFTGKAFVSKRNGDGLTADCNLNAEAFLGHSPFIFLFNKNDDGSSSVIDDSVNLSLEFTGKDGQLYFTEVVVKPIGSTENSVYARVTIMKPSAEKEGSMETQSNSLPLTTSFIMIYDVTDPGKDLKRFEEIEKQTIEKVNTRKPLDPYEDEVMRGMSGISYPAYNIGFGKWLLENHRFYDAYVTFQRVYNCLKHEVYHLENAAKDAFYHSCYGMGVCLMQLGFMDKASFYLQLAINGGEEYIGSYVESLALGSHNRVCYFLNQLRSLASKSEAAAKEVKRLEKVVADTESNYKVPSHLDTNVLPLGYVLHHLFDAAPVNVLGATICPTTLPVDNGEILTSQDDIWNLNLYEHQDAVIYVNYSRVAAETGVNNDASLFCRNNCMVLNLKSITGKNDEKFCRVNIVLPNFAQNDEKQYPGPFNWPKGASFVIGSEPLGVDYDRKDLKDIFEASLKLKNSYRWVEAMRGFEYIHQVLKIDYTKVSATDADEELFFDATYEFGSCLVGLGLLERATYYLDWVQEGYKVDYAREYVNCLCNNDDVRALDTINTIMSTMKQPEEKEYQEAYEYFIAFMKRRKVFVLVNRRMLDEAESLLNEMLESPITKEYAEQELALLKKAKEE